MLEKRHGIKQNNSPITYVINLSAVGLQMDEMDSTRFCTTREASRILGISVRTAQLWVENGTLEAWKTEGGHRRISLSSVEKVKRANRGKGVSDALREPIKILVIEDDNTLLRLYKLRIEAWSLPVELVTAHNGFEGLIMMGRMGPDLMITDLSMPEFDGFSLVRSLVRSPYREGMEIVVVTGLDQEEIERRGGLPDHILVLSKPVPFEELRELCARLLARRAELAA